MGIVLAAFAGLALALSGPGFAADDSPLIPDVPVPEVTPSVPIAASADSALPPAPKVPAEPITVSVNTAGGDVDVSVRVLSPGEDAADAAEPPVISDSDAPDITSDPAPAQEAPGDSAGGDAEGSNTNVTVRVLSPGADGAVEQDNPLAADDAPSAGPDRATEVTTSDAPAAPDDAVISPIDEEQYHSGDSQYQSEQQFLDETWVWEWDLSLDCDWNTTSSSAESGRPSSLDWTWQWSWDWACGAPPHPPPLDTLEAEVDGESAQTAPEAADGAVTRAPPTGAAQLADDVASEPWVWTWTFTFCGETVAVTLPIQTETELEWAWEWAWTWACGPTTAPEPSQATSGTSSSPSTPAPPTASTTLLSASPAGGGTASSSGVEPSVPAIAGVQLPVWVISLLPLPGRAESSMALFPISDSLELPTVSVVLGVGVPSSTVLVGTPVGHSAAAPPVTLGSNPMSPNGSDHEMRGATSVEQPAAAAGRRSEPNTALSAPGPSVEHTEKSPSTKRRSASARSDHSPLSPWLPQRPFHAAGAPGASSSSVPGASAAGVAALVALFILAAPGLGWRIRVARELRPRGTYGSSIDRPG